MVLTKRQEIVDLISHELKTPTVPILGYCEMLLNPKFGIINSDQEDAIKEIMKNINELQKFLNEIILKQKEVTDQDDTLQILPKELKTPLVPILGYCEMLSKKRLGDLDGDQLEAVKEIQVNAIRLNHLINDFWNAQQIELGKMKYLYEDVNVTKFIEQITEEFSKWMVKKSIIFTQNIESNLTIKIDKSKLREIFKNLIENAIVFVPDKDGIIEIIAESQENFVKFSVKDNGSGIPSDKISTLFKKFHQLDTSHRRTHGGGGLGLTISKGYIDAMGGKIEVQSELGKGTTFSFTILKQDET
jgi:signal transduction histidine kinase